MQRLGFDFGLDLQRAGFYPEGGGEVTCAVRPAGDARSLQLPARGTLVEVRVTALLGGGSVEAAEALRHRATSRLRERGIVAEAEIVPLPVQRSRGTAILVDARFEHSQACYGALLERGDTPAQAADAAVDPFLAFMASGGAVDEYLADQLVLPLALGAAGLRSGPPAHGHFRTSHVTQHLLTHAEVIQRFLPVRVAVRGELGQEADVIVAPEPQLAP
jgi:RNA 3'-terminal phosphate cyclase (ATP)